MTQCARRRRPAACRARRRACSLLRFGGTAASLKPLAEPAPRTLQDVTKAASPAGHLLTVALEDYFQVGAFSALIPAEHWPRFESRLARGAAAALEMLARGGHQATFFGSAWVARHHAPLLREVQAAGHEVALQGLLPADPEARQPGPLLATLRQGRDVLEQALGRQVAGHRIARQGGRGWLRAAELLPLLPLVHEAGFAYDASVCALGREFAGPAWQVPRRHGCGLWLVPVSTHTPMGLARPVLGQVPVAGGNWFRQLPATWPARAEAAWAAVHPGQPLVAYFHTWEFDDEQPRIHAAPTVQQLRHYRRLASMRGRFEDWLATRRTQGIAGHLGLERAPRPGAASETAGRPVTPAPPAWPATPATPATAPGLPGRRTPLTLVVPCFNEEAALPYLARTLAAFAAEHAQRLDLHYVFIDDGSADGTAAALAALCAQLPQACWLPHPRNRGIAAALLTGFAAVRTELAAVLDADCTFDPAQLPAMLDLLTEGVDVVSASPAHAAGAMKNVPPWRAALSRGAAALYRRVLRHRLTSYTSCFRVYRMAALRGLELSEPGFPGVTEILGRLDLAGCRIVEYPAVLETRVLGTSKIRVVRTAAHHLRLLLRLAAHRWWRRPLPSKVQAWQPNAG